MTNPFLSYAWLLYECGYVDEAYALARITDWDGASFDDLLQKMNDAMAEFTEAFGRQLVPALTKAAEAFSRFADVLP